MTFVERNKRKKTYVNSADIFSGSFKQNQIKYVNQNKPYRDVAIDGNTVILNKTLQNLRSIFPVWTLKLITVPSHSYMSRPYYDAVNSQ